MVKKLMEDCKWNENRARKDTVPCKQARIISNGVDSFFFFQISEHWWLNDRKTWLWGHLPSCLVFWRWRPLCCVNCQYKRQLCLFCLLVTTKNCTDWVWYFSRVTLKTYFASFLSWEGFLYSWTWGVPSRSVCEIKVGEVPSNTTVVK